MFVHLNTHKCIYIQIKKFFISARVHTHTHTHTHTHMHVRTHI